MRARKLTSAFAQRVSDAAYRVDEPRRSVLLGLATQVSDVDVERVRAGTEVVPPDALEDDGAREDLPRVPEEELEQRELGPREIDRTLATADLARAEVELEVREAQHVVVAPLPVPG